MASIQKLRTTPGHMVRRVHQVSNALFAAECGPFDITSVQYAALVAIAATPGLDATRLAHLIALDRSTIGDVLERLEGKGWVCRTPSSADRRIKRLELSRTGADLLAAVAPAVERVQQRLLAPLTPSERGTVMQLLARIAEAPMAAATPAPVRIPEPAS